MHALSRHHAKAGSRRVVSASLATNRPCSPHGGQGNALTTLRSEQRGFTLVELVLVIALAGVVAVMISTVLSRPLQGFVDQSQRAELTDQAATALNRMARDIRGAVPNSVRESPNGLDFVSVHEVGRYEESADGRLPACDATPTPTCHIKVLTEMDAGRVSESRWLVIYNVGAESGGEPVEQRNLWHPSNPGVVTPPNASFEWDKATQQLMVKNADFFRFSFSSPQRRLFLAKEVVRYRCESGEFLRETFDTLDLKSRTSSVLLADAVSHCAFTYQPGTHTRNALVTLRLSLSKGGETISLIQQVHVDNAP